MPKEKYSYNNRAFYGRIEKSIKNLPPLYFHNDVKIAMVTVCENRNPNQKEAPRASINWTYGDAAPEKVISQTGKLENNQGISRLTKQMFLKNYSNLINRLPNISSSYKINGQNYTELKAMAIDFQVCIFLF